MNQTVFLSELRKICLVVIAYCAGKGWLTPADSSLIVGLLPAVGLLSGPWLWGLYSMLNKKLVPADSVAIRPIDGDGLSAKVGDHIQIDNRSIGGAGTAKVVGALLAALLLSVLMIPNASAQSLTQGPRKLTGNVVADFANAEKPAPANTIDGALQSFGAGVQKIEKAIVDKGIADLQSAIKDATDHKDNISLPCWQANLTLLQSLPSQWPEPPSMPMGLALSIQVQRDLLNSITGNDATSLKVACAALWGDQLKIVANVGALIGVRIATGGLF
jgi:hypothetical protein